MRDLGTLGGSSGYYKSGASDLNEAGQVVGYSSGEGNWPTAFITGTNGMGMRNLGTLGSD